MTSVRQLASIFRFFAAMTGITAPVAASAEEQRSVDLGGSYTSDTFANLSGGQARGLRQMGLLEITAQADLAVVGVDGAEAYLSVQHVHGESLSGDLVGDAQVVSNIEAGDGLRLFEAWVSLPLARDVTVKAGLIDLNGIFDVQEIGELFISSSHGIGPDFSQSGLNGPSIFPTTSVAVVALWEGEGVAARAGLFDAVAGDPGRPGRTVIRLPGDTGVLMVGEGEIKVGAEAQVQLGAWAYSTGFERLRQDGAGIPTSDGSSRGGYAMVEGRFGSLGRHPLNGWLRAGIASAAVNPIALYIGGGLALGDEKSRWGVAIAHARLGAPGRAAGGVSAERAETAIELTHARAIGKYVTVQPTVQYVVNPGWDWELRNALVAGVRVALQH